MILSTPFINDPRVLKEARVLVDNGYQVSVFAWDRECKYPKQESKQGISIQRIHVKSSYGQGILQALSLSLFFLRVLWRLRKLEFAIIHCHDLETVPVGLVLKKLRGCKVIFDAHEDEYWYGSQGLLMKLTQQVGKVAERLLVRKVTHVLTVDGFQVNKYQRVGIENVSLVPNFPELGLTTPDSSHNRGNEIIIGRIGTIFKATVIEQILDAFVILGTQYANIRLFLAGNMGQGTKVIAERIHAIGDYVDFIPGYEPSELEKLYSKIDVCIMLYTPDQHRTSGFAPTKFFEALCFGVPVVVSDIGDVGRIVREENCGIVLDEITPESIAIAVKYLIDNPELRWKMGENGQRAVKEKYNWAVSAKELLAAYANLLTSEDLESGRI
jgi:glycosyltransferase involved in cell wall biosynthesis